MSTMTTDPAKVHNAKSAAYAAAKKAGLVIDYRAQGNTWTADVCTPDGKMFSTGETSKVTHYFTKPDVEFWTMVRMDVEDNTQDVVDIDYEEFPELDPR